MANANTGGCLCGEIRFEFSGNMDMGFFCHCLDCQKANGSSYTSGFLVPKEALRMVQGTVKGYSKKSDEGTELTREFCPTCGSGLFTVLEKYPDMVVIKTGSLDDPGDFKPKRHLFSRSERPWARVEDGAERL